MSFFSYKGIQVILKKAAQNELPITFNASTLSLASWSPPELESSSD
jgi:hypothetical protein